MSHITTTATTPLFNSKVYDALKWVALVALPAVGVLYFGLAEIWGLPYAVQIMGTTAALDTFLGVVLGISNHNYKQSEARFDGSVMVDTSNPNKDVLTFNLKQPADELSEKDSVELKIDTPPVGEGTQLPS